MQKMDENQIPIASTEDEEGGDEEVYYAKCFYEPEMWYKC